jgi:hypothetical protein
MRPVRRANFMVNSSAVRLAGDINAKVTDKASLDGLLAKIKAELTKLGPILDLEIVREPQGWTEGGVTVANRESSTARVQGLEPAVPFGLCCACGGRWCVSARRAPLPDRRP